MHPRRRDKLFLLQTNTTLALGSPGGMAQSHRSTMGICRIHPQRPIAFPSPYAKTLVLLLPNYITRVMQRIDPCHLYVRVRRVGLRNSPTAPIVRYAHGFSYLLTPWRAPTAYMTSRFVPPRRVYAGRFELERVLSKLRANKAPKQRDAAQDLLVRARAAGRLGRCVDPEASAPQESGNGKSLFFRRPTPLPPLPSHADAPYTQKHVLGALGITEDWYRECNETLSLAIAYGEGGERCEDARAVAASRDRTQKKRTRNSGPTDLLVLLRQVHEEYCERVNARRGEGQ